MAKIKGNFIMMNVSGMLGKQVVIKNRAGKQYMSAPPTIDENRPLTPNKAAWREKFKAFAAYGKYIGSIPEMKAEYKAVAKPGQTAYNVAFKDARYPPEVTAVSIQGYSGTPGDKIFVQAKDDFKVTAVKVTIYSASGEVIEQGDAVEDGILWMYIVTNLNNTIKGSKILVAAYDLPGNVGVREIVL